MPDTFPNISVPLSGGDILLCAGIDVVRAATNSKFGHVAVYIGNGVVVTSLTRQGVNFYDIAEGAAAIQCVRRPVELGSTLGSDIRLKVAKDIFEQKWRGQPYGWGDCASDVGLPNSGGGFNCSHTVAQFEEDASAPQFDPAYVKSRITPRDFELTNQSQIIWVAGAASP